MNENDRVLIEKLRSANPPLGAVIQSLIVTNLDEEVILKVIYELDDMATFKRYGEIKILVEDGKVIKLVGQRGYLINKPLKKVI